MIDLISQHLLISITVVALLIALTAISILSYRSFITPKQHRDPTTQQQAGSNWHTETAHTVFDRLDNSLNGLSHQ